MKKTVSLLAATILLCVVLAAPAAAAAPRPGEILPEIPMLTTRKEVSIIENSKIQDGEFTIAWEEFEGADKYSIRVFFNIYIERENRKGLEIMFREEHIVDGNELTISGLKPDTRYTVIVYALDADGKEIATFDRLPVGTVEGFGMVEDEVTQIQEQTNNNDDDKGLSTTLIIVIAVAVFAVIAAVVVVIIVLSTGKKSTKKEE